MLRVDHGVQAGIDMMAELSYVSVAHGSDDVPGDLLLSGHVVVGAIMCSCGIIRTDGTIENWSSVWSTAGRYRCTGEDLAYRSHV